MTSSSVTKPTKPLKPLLPGRADEIPAPAPEIVCALQALSAGTASSHQQQIALHWIIQTAAGQAYYWPGENGRRDTDFGMGRAFVGQIILGLLKINPLIINKQTT